MIKKIIYVTVLCLMISASAFAAQTDDNAFSEARQLSEERHESRGDRGDMSDRPRDGREHDGQPPEPPRMDEINENEDVNIAAPQQPSENSFAGSKDSENIIDEQNDMKNNNNNKSTEENAPEITEKGGFGFHKQNGGKTENDVDVPELSVNNEPEAPQNFISFIKAYSTSIISLILLALAFVFVKLYN